MGVRVSWGRPALGAVLRPAGTFYFVTMSMLLQVPAHRRLSAGFDDRAASRLVETNWLRTALWSARSALILVVLAQAINA